MKTPSPFTVTKQYLLIATVAMFSCLGCQDSDLPLVTAEGIVVYEGTPVKNATVIFTPQSGPIAIGTTDDQGAFQLATRSQAGAVVGTHRVSITAIDSGSPAQEQATSVAATGELLDVMPGDYVSRSLIPERYAAPQTSGLTAEVVSDAPANQFWLELKD